MPLSIKIVTTANRTRFFHQSDERQVLKSLALLTGVSPIFSAHSLMLSSSLQTEVFSPRRIALIELEGAALLSRTPGPGDFRITAFDSDEARPVIQLDDAVPATFRVDFYFVGGYVLSTQVDVDNTDVTFADRTRRVTQLFEVPQIWYKTAGGGVGLINPASMTRAVITPSGDTLPADALLVDDY